MSTAENLKEKIETWRNDSTHVEVLIIAGEKREKGEVFIREWSVGKRKIKFLRALILCWGLAALSVFIPIVHFIAVPAFFFAGLVVPFIAYSTKSIVLGGIGSCPECKETFEIAKAADRWPLNDICDKCHRHVRIERL